MSSARSWLIVAVAGAMLLVAAGCGGGGGAGKGTDTRTPGQYFKEHQASTVTPHGKIVTSSVEEIDGKIRYRTEDNKKWRVGYSKRVDGTYEYGTPQEDR
jgi:hypothetical protein